MPVQTPQWTDVLCCCICYNVFDGNKHQPVSLVCGHTACRVCLLKLKSKQCPFDQSAVNISIGDLPQNSRILKILDILPPSEEEKVKKLFEPDDGRKYREAIDILETLCVYLKRAASDKGGSVWSPQLSRPMQRKLLNLLCCNLVEPEGRNRALKAVRSVGERSLTELLLMHQNPYHLSSNLWATVRARGCQFLGPAMQEEVLKLVLLALSEGALISRKVLVMYIVQTLEKEYPQASKTSVGHVVQLLYRASCFNVIKRDAESSLMQLKEDFRTYESLRREHDAQIVQIAMEAGLRISPDQWSALLYGDQTHKSHMQSIIDRLQTPQSFFQCIQELLIGLQRTGDPGRLVDLRSHFELLADIDASQGENSTPSWPYVLSALKSVKAVVDGQVKFCENYNTNRNQRENVERSVVAYKFKTSMCRDIGDGKFCPRNEACTFAHSLEEMERYRARSRLMGYRSNNSRQLLAGGSSTEDNTPGEVDGDFSPEKELSRKQPVNQSWNAQIHPLEAEQQRKQSFVMVPPNYRHGTMPSSSSVPPPPPPTMPSVPPAVQQIIAADITATPVLTATPPPPPPLGSMLNPAPTVLSTPGNVAYAPGPFPINAVQQLPQFGAVRYQIIRPTQPPPAQLSSQMPPPLSVTAPPEFGYYWYPPTGSGAFQSRVSGEVLHLEVPLARVVAGPSHNLPPGYSEYFANQQNFAPTLETYYMYHPSSGIPVRFDEPVYQHQMPAATVTVIPANMNMNVCQPPPRPVPRPIIEEVPNDWPSTGGVSSHCATTEKDKKSKLQLLEKKREEILARLEMLRKDFDDAGPDNIGIHLATSVLHEDVANFNSSSVSAAKLMASLQSGCSLTSVAFSDNRLPQAASNPTWTCVYSNTSKDVLVPTSSVPILDKGSKTKHVQRSLSTEENGKAKQTELYSPWSTKSPCDASNSSAVWRHETPTTTMNGGGNVPSSEKSKQPNANSTSSGGYYATRPYIPEDYIDIKHLTDDVLRKELQQLPQNSKRAYYVKLELESRESDMWRSEDDQVIPFSGDPHVSRYGPISRSRITITSNSLVVSPSSTITLASELVHVKDMLQQPLPTAAVQPPKEQPLIVQNVDPSLIDVSAIPIVFQASSATMDPNTVGEKLEKVVEMKEKLESLPMMDGASSVEREQLKIDLDIINKEIATLDKETEEEYLLKELESVNLNIEELQK